MLCSLVNIKKVDFFLKKRPTDYNPKFFWIVTVQDWSKTSPANAIRPLETLDFSNVVDLDNLLDKKSKTYAAFLIINE